jgi:peptidoglycan-associated lipoprotein
MKKISIYSFLVASLLFTGCSEKNVEMDVNNGQNTSESALNTIPDTQIEQVMDGSFTVAEKSDNGVYYIINGKKVLIENIYFGFDKYNLTADMKDKAMANASKLSALNTTTIIKVSGNTDEWGTDEYNYALGLKRAKAVKDVYTNNGVDAKVTLISLGESNPVCSEKTKDCWQKNRRVENTLAK